MTRTRTPVSMLKGRDHWWEEEVKYVDAECPAEEMDAEDVLFILYTSGSTGKPKGVVHTCGGYMVYTTYTFANVFQYEPGEIHFCTADIGWITGHSYIVYGPLCYGATSLMFEGIPTYPDAGRFWEIIEKHKVNILYTAPTAIRSLMSFGLEYVKDHDLSSLTKLGSVGEPINEEAWQWYKHNIGKDNTPARGYLVANRNRRHDDYAPWRALPPKSPPTLRCPCRVCSPCWWTKPGRKSRAMT